MQTIYRRGFTLVELLVVIAIIGLLIAMLLPSINAARESGRRTACANNLHQLITALDVYENQKGKYPAGRDGCDGITTGPCNRPDNDHRVGTSAFVRLLPFLEQQPLFDSCTEVFPASDPTRPFYQVSAAVESTRMGTLICASDTTQPYYPGSTDALASYAMVHGDMGPDHGISGNMKVYNTGMFAYMIEHTRGECIDGTSNTMFVGEIYDGHHQSRPNRWYIGSRHENTLRTTVNPINTPPGQGITTSPYGIPLDGSMGSRHPNGAQFAFGDSHVKFLRETIDLDTYKALSTRAGSETTNVE